MRMPLKEMNYASKHSILKDAEVFLLWYFLACESFSLFSFSRKTPWSQMSLNPHRPHPHSTYEAMFHSRFLITELKINHFTIHISLCMLGHWMWVSARCPWVCHKASLKAPTTLFFRLVNATLKVNGGSRKIETFMFSIINGNFSYMLDVLFVGVVVAGSTHVSFEGRKNESSSTRRRRETTWWTWAWEISPLIGFRLAWLALIWRDVGSRINQAIGGAVNRMKMSKFTDSGGWKLWWNGRTTDHTHRDFPRFSLLRIACRSFSKMNFRVFSLRRASWRASAHIFIRFHAAFPDNRKHHGKRR